MRPRSLLFGLAALLCAAIGHALEPGKPLPPLRVESMGEILLEGERMRYAAWNSAGLQGAPVQVIQYMAARLSSKSMNQPFTDRLKASGFPPDSYHVTTIVNLDDALFGTRKFVLSELEANKRRYYLSSIVADEHGLGLAAWQLAPKSSAIIILGSDGHVRFFRDGPMSEAEIEAALQLVAPAAHGGMPAR